MNKWRSCLTAVLCALVTSSLALAAPPAATSQPAAEAVLKVIPAGTMGYVVLHNAKKAGDDVDKFLKDIGVADLLKDSVPEGVLKAVLEKANLGAGFNPNGGVAVALLDPSAFGIDLIKMLQSAMPGAGATSAPAASTAPGAGPSAAGAPVLPVVIFLPGTGVKEVLGNFNPEAAQPYMKVKIGKVELFAAPLGSYVLLSPNPKALEAVAKATRKADDELKGSAAGVVRGSAIAARLNVKAAYPVIQKAAKALDLLSQAKDEGLADSAPEGLTEVYKAVKPAMAAYLYQLSQIDELAMGVRVAETGVVADAAISYVSDSAYGKANAALKPPDPPLMDSLSGNLYVMAFTSAVLAGDAASKEIAAKNLETLLNNPLLEKVPAAQRTKLQALYQRFMEEVSGIAFAMSGSVPEAQGAMSFSLVLKGRDSEKIKALLGETADLLTEILKAPAGGDNADQEESKVVYEKAVEKVEGISADRITVTAPQLGMASMVLGQMFGETAIAPLVAAPDKSTVVITFGGGTDTLANALKAATGKEEKEKRILAQAETAEAMKFMPKNLEAVMFFNVGNYFDAMMAFMKKMGGGGGAIPFALTCKVPIAVGAGTDGATQVVTLYVPTQVVKEIVGIVTGFGGMMRGGGPGPGGGKPVPGGEEF